jgi:uncharacterized protein
VDTAPVPVAALSGLRLPSDREIRRLHERCAPTAEAFELVYTHCEIVCRIAEQLLGDRDHDVDIELVRAGCLLHDVGVYRLFSLDGTLAHRGYVRHGVLGHELLHELGYPDQLCRFCSCHTGMGITRADIATQRLPLPLGDYVAETVEELLVMYGDKFHSKRNPPTFVSAATYGRHVRRFGPGKADRFASLVTRFGEPDLQPLAAEYGHAGP